MISRKISLRKYNTFGLDYKADRFLSVKSEKEIIEVLKTGILLDETLLVLGGGTNLLFISDFSGIIIHSAIEGISIEEEHADYVIVSSGAGMKWDSFVEWTVNQGYGGLENLSYIPGTVGASPVQNIGAYGSEVKDTIEMVRAITLADSTIREFNNKECMFGYRDSIFKRDLKGKYIITRVYFRLKTRPVLNTGYGSLKQEAEKLGALSLETVREAVINIRKSKLPDPEIIGNAGSFFKNPVVQAQVADTLKSKYTGLPCYNDTAGYVKIAAGWLIDQCGWKGKRIGDAGVHDMQALVLVNHGKATGKEILELSAAIRKSVFDKFGIELQREVEVI
jgi:UDP-N-acetylmuramate dehydrogenase